MTTQNASLTRREALARTGTVGLGLLALGAVGCKSEGGSGALSCTDTKGLTPDEVTQRTTILKYVDASPEPAKNCLNCIQYKAGADAAGCGTCIVVKGPINPKGYCSVWAAKPA